MSKKFWMTGLVPATFTPMHEDGRLNPGAVAPMVERLLALRSDALFVCGTTGESSSLTTAERMHGGDGRTASTALVDVVREHARAHHVLDMAQLARESGTITSAVMLGAIAASGLLPFARADYEAVIAGAQPGSASSR